MEFCTVPRFLNTQVLKLGFYDLICEHIHFKIMLLKYIFMDNILNILL